MTFVVTGRSAVGQRQVACSTAGEAYEAAAGLTSDHANVSVATSLGAHYTPEEFACFFRPSPAQAAASRRAKPR